jgi:hypothetical protein
MNIPNEIKYKIFSFLQYKDLLKIKSTNKIIYNTIKKYENDNYKICIKKNKSIFEYLIKSVYKEMENIVKIEKVKIHEYKLYLKNNKNYNFKYFKEQEILEIINDYIFKLYFSFYYNNKYHMIKAYKIEKNIKYESDIYSSSWEKYVILYKIPFFNDILDEKESYEISTIKTFDFIHKIIPDIEEIFMAFMCNSIIISKIKYLFRYNEKETNDGSIEIVNSITQELENETKIWLVNNYK